MPATLARTTARVLDSFSMCARLTGSKRALIGEPGLAVAVVSCPGHSTLVLYADMGEINEGASATNAAEIVCTAVLQRLHLTDRAAAADFRWFEVDSSGFVDTVTFSPSGSATWAPLRSTTGAAPRSIDALLQQPGGLQAWDAVLATIQRAHFASTAPSRA